MIEAIPRDVPFWLYVRMTLLTGPADLLKYSYYDAKRKKRGKIGSVYSFSTKDEVCARRGGGCHENRITEAEDN